eukprot:1159987-Pelagomonas_calceolata.AAC.2
MGQLLALVVRGAVALRASKGHATTSCRPLRRHQNNKLQAVEEASSSLSSGDVQITISDRINKLQTMRRRIVLLSKLRRGSNQARWCLKAQHPYFSSLDAMLSFVVLGCKTLVIGCFETELLCGLHAWPDDKEGAHYQSMVVVARRGGSKAWWYQSVLQLPALLVI